MGYESNRQIRGGKTMSNFVTFSVAYICSCVTLL